MVSLQREIDEMLAVTRREAEEIRQGARRDAAARVAEERAALAAAEQEAFDRALAEGRNAVEAARSGSEAHLASLRDRLARRHEDSVSIIVRMATEDDT
jgi:vacuolar-type H+-ATPase subunit E/Vma4